MLCNKKRTQWPLFIALLTLIVGIYLGSYLVIFEAHYEFQPHMQNTISADNDLYAIYNHNGTYDIYYGDIYIESVNTLEYFSSNITVYTPNDIEHFVK